MFYAAKFLQLLGLLLCGIEFVQKFGGKMDYHVFGASLTLFAAGWIIERFMLTRR